MGDPPACHRDDQDAPPPFPSIPKAKSTGTAPFIACVHALDWLPQRQLSGSAAHFQSEVTCLLARSGGWIMPRDDSGSVLLESATS